MPRFQVHAVADDDDAVEGQPRLGAVPGDELVDGVFVHASRGGGAEAVEHRQFAMIQIWKPKHSATVIRLDSVFAHGDGLPCRRIGTMANRLGDASIRRVWTGRVLSAIAWFQQLTTNTGCRGINYSERDPVGHIVKP